MMGKLSFLRNKGQTGEEWMSVSDLMAGLMMVFLFISIIYAKDALNRNQNISTIVTEWQNAELKIYQALYDEFADDLPKWNAMIDKENLTIRFFAPDILFESGSHTIKPQFESILADFIPRYVRLLADNFSQQIAEIRIEGHTSSEWNWRVDENTAFIHNMELSQARTRSVLEYSMRLFANPDYLSWIRKTMSANGLSSAHPILVNGMEDRKKSRRVDFAIRTRTKEILFNVFETIYGGNRL